MGCNAAAARLTRHVGYMGHVAHVGHVPRVGRAFARIALASLLALTCAFAASSAFASGFLNPRLADPQGHPALPNPYALYFNPAAIGGIHGTEIVLDGTLAYRTVDYDRSPSALSPHSSLALSDPDYRAANIGSAHAANFAAIPFIAATSDFGTRQFFAGVGAYVPFGGAVEFDQRPELAASPVRGAIDGSQRWSVISGVQRSLYTTGAVGLRLPEAGLSLAVSGSMVLSDIAHAQARNTSGYDDTSAEGRALLEVSGTHFAVSAGLFWEPLPEHRLRVGVSYAVRPGLGEMRWKGTLRQFYIDDGAKDVDLLQSFPDVLRLGVTARPTKQLELRFDSEYVGWSSFGRQCIVERGAPCNLASDGSEVTSPPQVILAVRRQWRDAGAMRLGAGYFTDEKTEVYGAVGYDTSAVPKATLESTYPDAFKMMFSLGVRRKFSDLLALGASYTYVHYLPVTTGQQSQATLAGASKVPNQDGSYHSEVMFFNLNARLSF